LDPNINNRINDVEQYRAEHSQTKFPTPHRFTLKTADGGVATITIWDYPGYVDQYYEEWYIYRKNCLTV
jgi:hypothetical protein